ncbi:hypothetical protein FWG76_01920 [Candidatus Saccharibacteria bacterium]|nr:hypothetical protein [Candidatus Saccharibacteria bacterium]
MEARDLVWTGILANNSKFFGGAASTEAFSTARNSYGGGWNWDRTDGIFSTFPWLLSGHEAIGSTQAGVFAFYPHNGGITSNNASHRTILLGY